MRYFLSFILFLSTLSVAAIPAKKEWRTLTLADGTTIEAMLQGDEYGHWYVDGEGQHFELRDGMVHYLTAFEKANKEARRSQRMESANASRSSRMKSARRIGTLSTFLGSKKGLVILVNYKDKSMLSKNTQTVFNDRFNKVGYKGESVSCGSVHDFFHDQSYGKFDLTFDVVGPVTVSQNLSYYGSNDSDGNDKYPCTMVIEALKLIDSQVNFKDYDWDGDGEVDQVFVIYAGYGEAAGGAANTIWPHEWDLSSGKSYGDGSGAQTMDGVRINTYAVSCELSGGSGSITDGIGTACHEFSHCLGYPDFYDAGYSGGQGMMAWDLLDSGSYNGTNDRGETPCGYSAYERMVAGWLDPIELSEPCTVKDMPSIQDEPVAYIIYNDKNNNEYYMLENRDHAKWFAYPSGTSGMLITHVTYDAAKWASNDVNTTASLQRMTYFPADNYYGTKQSSGGQSWYTATLTDYKGDLYPGSKNNSSLTDTSTPAAKLNTSNSKGTKLMGHPIENIALSASGLISFTFDGGFSLETPVLKPVTAVSSTGFTANWKPVTEAESYEIKLSQLGDKDPSEALLLTEDFTSIASIADGTAAKLTGWTLTACYGTKSDKLRLASGKNSGSAVSPSFTCNEGTVTVVFNASSYGTDGSSAKVAVGGQTKSFTLTAEEETYIAVFTGVSGSQKVTFSADTKKRWYLHEVQVYDGEFTADDLSSLGARSEVAMRASSTIKNITGTSYTFTGLTPAKYAYQVRAVSGDITSAWSARDVVDITTGVNDIQADETLSQTPRKVLKNGRILVETPQKVYNLNGSIVKK